MRFCTPIIVLALLVACADRDSGRGGGSSRRFDAAPEDTGFTGPLDSGGLGSPDVTLHDGGAVDAGARPDATPLPDAFVPPDSGEMDAGLTPVTVSIYAIQDVNRVDHPPADAPVIIDDVVVTAVQTTGTAAGSFWVQERAGGPYSAVHAFKAPTSVVPAVTVGERVSITGRYQEYFDLTEVVLESVTSLGLDTPPPPQIVSAVDLAGGLAESFEGVLVTVQSVAVINVNPDLPMDFGEYQVSGGLRIDDQLYHHPVRPAMDFFFSSLTGVLHYTFSQYKLEPRSILDLNPAP